MEHAIYQTKACKNSIHVNIVKKNTTQTVAKWFPSNIFNVNLSTAHTPQSEYIQYSKGIPLKQANISAF